MTYMIERVARAIYDRDYAESVATFGDTAVGVQRPFEALPGTRQRQFREYARAAIPAMRGDDVPVFEDISNMDKEWKQSALPADVLNAGECACWDNGGRSFGYNGVTNIWRAMIDAVLKGDKP